MMEELNNNLSRVKKLWNEERYNEALEIALVSAKQGHVESQVFVGNVYLTGVEGIEQNLDESVKWLSMSVKSGSIVEHYLLGIANYYLLDYSAALSEFSIASKSNYFAADYQIGKMYYYGVGVQKNIDMAYQYFLVAKKYDHILASKQIAVILMKGHKGFINIIKGMALFITAFFKCFAIAYKNPDSEKLFE